MNFKDAVRTLLYKEKPQRSDHQLYTKWGEALKPEQVLTEYPRPQLRRDNFTILNGYWDYGITKDPAKPENFEGRILVPFSPESPLSGVNRQLQPGEYLWYQRKLMLNGIHPGMRCILHFGAVDQRCEIWVNDFEVAEHLGGYLPFSIDITKDIKEGENILTLMVTDESETSYHSRGKQKLSRGGLWYTAQSGIWQTVWYEWVPDRYITSVKITPNVLKREVTIQIAQNNKQPSSMQSGQASNADMHTNSVNRELYQVLVIEDGKMKQVVTSYQPVLTVSLGDCRYWSPEQPFLYDLVITAGEDQVESYFAMRSVEIRKDSSGTPRIFLNQKPYFQNGLLDQGYWPDGLYTAPSDEALIFDIQQAKRLGFNMLRKHIKVEPLRWYYHCDRLGMIVWQDIVNGGGTYKELLVGYLPTFLPCILLRLNDKRYRLFAREDPEGRREWSMECRETVELLYNSPCIACWVPFNEAWGQFDAKEAYRLIKELDATRLIDHASGWYDQHIGDFESIHNYFHKLKVKVKKRAVVFSEFGGYACYIPEHSFSWGVFGYRIFFQQEDLNNAFQKLYREEIKKLWEAGLSATVYTQLCDVEDEVNGLYTYDRKICKVEPLSWLDQ